MFFKTICQKLEFQKVLSFILRTDFLFEIFLTIKIDKQKHWYYFGEKIGLFFLAFQFDIMKIFYSNLHCKLKTKDRKSPLILAYLYFIISYLVIIYFHPVFIFFMVPKELDYEKKSYVILLLYYYIYCLLSCSMYSL